MTDDRVPPVIDIRNASVRTAAGARILDAVELRVDDGEHTAILGPNGSGKSSLIRLVTHELRPWAGEGADASVRVFGRDRWNVFELRRLLGVVSPALARPLLEGPEGPRALDVVLSAFFASGELFPHHEVTPEMEERALSALEAMEAAHLAARRVLELSTGEARRVAIARALAPGPRALLLDEPSSGLDVVATGRLLATLRRVARAGTTLVLVTHHVEEILPEISRVVLLRRGRVLASGPADRMLTPRHLSAAFDAPIRVTARGDGFREMREAGMRDEG